MSPHACHCWSCYPGTLSYSQLQLLPSSLQYKTHHSRQFNCWSLGCSRSIPCRHYPNYILIFYLTPGFSELGRGNCKTTQEKCKCWDLVCLILEVWQYINIWRVGTCDCIRQLYDNEFVILSMCSLLTLFMEVLCFISIRSYCCQWITVKENSWLC